VGELPLSFIHWEDERKKGRRGMEGKDGRD